VRESGPGGPSGPVPAPVRATLPMGTVSGRGGRPQPRSAHLRLARRQRCLTSTPRSGNRPRDAAQEAGVRESGRGHVRVRAGQRPSPARRCLPGATRARRAHRLFPVRLERLRAGRSRGERREPAREARRVRVLRHSPPSTRLQARHPEHVVPGAAAISNRGLTWQRAS
jgi:hypothetical protein